MPLVNPLFVRRCGLLEHTAHCVPESSAGCAAETGVAERRRSKKIAAVSLSCEVSLRVVCRSGSNANVTT